MLLLSLLERHSRKAKCLLSAEQAIYSKSPARLMVAERVITKQEPYGYSNSVKDH